MPGEEERVSKHVESTVGIQDSNWGDFQVSKWSDGSYSLRIKYLDPESDHHEFKSELVPLNEKHPLVKSIDWENKTINLETRPSQKK